MPFCMNCGQQLPEGAKFCSGCGTAMGEVKSETTQRKTIYEGELHKCPHCGEVLDSFIAVCPSCGYELRGSSTTSAVKEFASKLDNVTTEYQKENIIRNFPIPNTKEDILEFMILAATNIGDNLEKDISAAWQSKTEQAYQKAQIIFQDEKEFSRIQNIYSQVCAKLTKQKKIEKVQKAGNILSELMPVLPNVIVVTGWLISIFVLLPLCRINLDTVGTNGSQLLLMLDFIAGAILIPFAFRCSSHLPKLVTSLGLILSIVVLIPLCGKNLDNVGTNAFQLILIVDIICSVVIFVRMFKNKHKSETPKTALNGVSFVIALICVVIMLAVYGVGSITTAITAAKDNAVNEQEKQQAQSVTYEWPHSELTARIPKPSINTGEVWNNGDSEFWLILQGVTTEDYLEYIDACKEKGFIIDTEKTDMFFEAYDSDGYYLKLSYLDFMEELDIKITEPRTNENLEWPTVGLATLIPKPQGTKGKITIDTHIQFLAYIGEMSKEDYNEYVNECIEKGFNVEYSKYDKVYSAKNKKGDSIRIEYEGNNTISISMYAHD